MSLPQVVTFTNYTFKKHPQSDELVQPIRTESIRTAELQFERSPNEQIHRRYSIYIDVRHPEYLSHDIQGLVETDCIILTDMLLPTKRPFSQHPLCS